MKKISFVKMTFLILSIVFSFIILTGCMIVPATGTNSVKIIVQDHYQYFVYMNGNLSTGTYLGRTNWSGIGIFYNIPAGDHSFYVISADYRYEGWISKTIEQGNNSIEISTSYIW